MLRMHCLTPMMHTHFCRVCSGGIQAKAESRPELPDGPELRAQDLQPFRRHLGGGQAGGGARTGYRSLNTGNGYRTLSYSAF